MHDLGDQVTKLALWSMLSKIIIKCTKTGITDSINTCTKQICKYYNCIFLFRNK